MDIVLPIVGGLLLLGALLIILFSFALLRDREHSRSLAATNVDISADSAPVLAGPDNVAKRAQNSMYATRIGEHYITGSDQAAVVTPARPDPARTHSPNYDDKETASGLTITGFDSAGSKVYLTINHSVMASQRWGVTLGRDRTLSNFEVRDSDRYVSRRHFRLRWDTDNREYMIEDLGSASGTRLNGDLIQPFRLVPLRPGNTILIGRLELDVGRA